MGLEDVTVFVTGGFGFIGANLVRHLDALGAHVVALRRDWVRPENPIAKDLADRISIVNGDLRDTETLIRAINEYEAQLCFHLAAQSIVGVANRHPRSTFSSNIEGTWNFLEACRQTESVDGIVVASSDKAYGTSLALPYSETHPLSGENPYDASKACADLLAQCYGAFFGLPVVISRCSNVYGRGDLNFSRIVPDICKSVALNLAPQLRTDGSPLRDFIHVDDVLRAYQMIGEALLEERCRHEVFNIGSGEPTKVIDVTGLIIEASGKDLTPNLSPSPPRGEILDQYVSIEKIGKLLGWRPEIGLEKGLRRTYRWYDEYFQQRT